MNELLIAFEAAIRRIVQEELTKHKIDFGELMNENADKFDRNVLDGLENSSKFKGLVEDIMSTLDKSMVEDIIDNYDFDGKIDDRIEAFDYGDKMTEAARELTFEVRVA